MFVACLSACVRASTNPPWDQMQSEPITVRPIGTAVPHLGLRVEEDEEGKGEKWEKRVASVVCLLLSAISST